MYGGDAYVHYKQAWNSVSEKQVVNMHPDDREFFMKFIPSVH